MERDGDFLKLTRDEQALLGIKGPAMVRLTEVAPLIDITFDTQADRQFWAIEHGDTSLGHVLDAEALKRHQDLLAPLANAVLCAQIERDLGTPFMPDEEV